MLGHVSGELVDHSIEIVVGQTEAELPLSSFHRALSSRSVRTRDARTSTSPISFEPYPAVRIPLPMLRNPSAPWANRNSGAGNPSPRAPPCVMTGCPVKARSSSWHRLEPSWWRSYRALLHGSPLPATIWRRRHAALLDSAFLMVRRSGLRGDLHRRCQESKNHHCSDRERRSNHHGDLQIRFWRSLSTRCQRSRMGRRWSSFGENGARGAENTARRSSEDLHEGGVDEELAAPVDAEDQLIS